MSQDANIYVCRALRLLQKGLLVFVKKRMEFRFESAWEDEITKRLKSTRYRLWDSYGLLKIMKAFWGEAFGDLGRPILSDVRNALSARNQHAHDENFTHKEANDALASMNRLLGAVSKHEIGTQKFTEAIDVLQKEINTSPQPHAGIAKPQTPISPTTSRPRKSNYMKDLVLNVEKNSLYRQHLFDSELQDMLKEAKERGERTIRVVSKELCYRVVDEYVDGVMVMSSDAMWAIWEWQGSRPERVKYRSPKGFSNLLEIEFDTGNLPPEK